MRKIKKSLHHIRIVDPEMLRSVLRSIDGHFESHRAAARELGLVHSTYLRLLNGDTTDFMRADTYRKIRRALEGHAYEFGLINLFESCVMEGAGFLVMRRYEEWARNERQRLEDLGAREVLEEMYGERRSRYYFDNLLERASGVPSLPPEDDNRLWVALYRVVEPFLAVESTWGIERGWQELRDQTRPDGKTELQYYLRTATRRERIILNRERPFDRIRSQGLEPPPEFFANLVDEEELADNKPTPPGFWGDLLEDPEDDADVEDDEAEGEPEPGG